MFFELRAEMRLGSQLNQQQIVGQSLRIVHSLLPLITKSKDLKRPKDACDGCTLFNSLSELIAGFF